MQLFPWNRTYFLVGGHIHWKTDSDMSVKNTSELNKEGLIFFSPETDFSDLANVQYEADTRGRRYLYNFSIGSDSEFLESSPRRP